MVDKTKRRNTVILIPALNPPKVLLDYIDELKQNGFEHIIIVNDGSDKKRFGDFFEQIKNKLTDGDFIITHAINLGKGRALKNGFNLFLNEFENNEEIKGIITVDSDGQHTVEDVIKLDNYFATNPAEKEFVLGVRSFKYDHVPFKSRFGNELTSKVFRLLYGKKLQDTQTGLRGIPKEIVKDFMELRGERFEYETNQLIQVVRNNIPFKEIEIKTVYIDNNSETHFDPIRDSIAIYKLLFGSFFKYMFSSISASIIDLGLFQIFFMLLNNRVQQSILLATAMARVCSSLYNYMMNKNVVFENKGSHKNTFVRYYALCVVQMLCSAGLVSLVEMLLPIPPVIIKAVVDTILFCISFQIQRRYVFVQEKK